MADETTGNLVSVEEIIERYQAGNLTLDEAKNEGIMALMICIPDGAAEGFTRAKALAEAEILIPYHRLEGWASNEDTDKFNEICLELLDILVTESGYEWFSKFHELLLSNADMEDLIDQFLENNSDADLFEEFFELDLISAEELNEHVLNYLNNYGCEDIEQIRTWVSCDFISTDEAQPFITEMISNGYIDLSEMDELYDEGLINLTEVHGLIVDKIKSVLVKEHGFSESFLDGVMGARDRAIRSDIQMKLDRFSKQLRDCI